MADTVDVSSKLDMNDSESESETNNPRQSHDFNNPMSDNYSDVNTSKPEQESDDEHTTRNYHSYDFEPIPQVRPVSVSNPVMPAMKFTKEELARYEQEIIDSKEKVILDRICICGKKTNHQCGACKTKYYCSKKCQLIDRKYHKMICKPFAMVETSITHPKSGYDLETKRGIFASPMWKKYFEIVYTTFYRKSHDDYKHEDTTSGSYYATWIQIIDDEKYGAMPSDLICGLFYLVQEPDRLFMHIQKSEDERTDVKFLLDQDSTVFKTTADHGKSVAYPMLINIPSKIEFYIDWQCRAYNGAEDLDDEIDED